MRRPWYKSERPIDGRHLRESDHDSSLAAALLVSGFAVPAFAQSAEIVCDDFLGLDNAKQMETIAEVQTMMSEQQRAARLAADACRRLPRTGCRSPMRATEMMKAAK